MKVKKIIQNNLFAIKYYVKYAPLYALFDTIYIILVSAVWVIEGPITLKFIFDFLAQTPARSFKEIILFLLLVACISIFRHIYGSIIIEYVQPISNAKIKAKLREELFEKACKMDLEYYETPQFYTDFVWAASQADSRIISIFSTYEKFVARLSEILFLGGFIITVDYTLFIFAFIALGLRLFFNSKIVKKRFEVNKEVKPVERERDYIGRVFYLSDYAKEIRLSNVHEILYKRFSQSAEKIENIWDKGGKEISGYRIVSNVLEQIFTEFLMYMYLAYKILVSTELSFGDFGSLISAVNSITHRMRQFVDICTELGENSLYVDKFKKFLEYEPKIELQSGKSLPDKIGTIEFKNVSFTYHGEKAPSLKNINLKIEPYQKIAIVGYNGAGKSTLVKLLMRLYDVSEGEITLDGVNIKEFETEKYRKEFGAAFQDFQIFAATLGENVAMNFNFAEDEDKIIDALKHSGFEDKLLDLPLGIKIPLTKEFYKEGTNLSGGESQKVAISRVFYKPCRYAILDEPSSALDPISEYNLNQNMITIAENKTVIFISHRLSTTCMADKIYMLEKGEIIEQGSHKELIELNGKYAEMFNKQAEKYRNAV